MKRRLPALLVLLAAGVAHAQAPPSDFVFEHLTVREGLPENSAFDLLQDRRGFLWFGTQNGLVRYDGHAMRVFRHEAQNSRSLCNWNIYRMLEDQRGILWLGSLGVLMRFDPATEQTTCFPANPDDANAPSDPHAGDLILDKREGIWITYAPDAYWVGNVVTPWRRFLDRVDTRTGRLTRFRHDPRTPHSLAADTLSGRGMPVLVTAGGDVWVALYRGGLDRFDARTGRFAHVRPDAANPNALSPGTPGFLYEAPSRPGVLWLSVEAPRGERERSTASTRAPDARCATSTTRPIRRAWGSRAPRRCTRTGAGGCGCWETGSAGSMPAQAALHAYCPRRRLLWPAPPSTWRRTRTAAGCSGWWTRRGGSSSSIPRATP